jgi:histidinol-phosphate aminotransferase
MGRLVTPSIEKIRAYQPGKPVEELERELGISNAVKLASNENPLGPSEFALRAMREHVGSVHRYPDAAAYRLREKLAAKHGVGMGEIIQGNGSNELIDLIVRAFTTATDHIVFAEPSFVVYELAALAHGVPYTAVPLRNFTHDLTAMAAAVTPATKVLFVANPNNPTGTYVSRDAVEHLFRQVPPEVIIVMDEAYIEYADAGDYPDSLTLRRLRERLVVLRTFSKIYGLAAMRVGYGIAPEQLVDYMNRIRNPFNVGTLGQEAAIAALDDVDHVERSRRINASERRSLTVELERLGLRVAPSQANFVYVDLGRPAREVYEALLRKGVIVRVLGSSTFARITIGLPEENTRLLAALAEVLG